jgi:gliding motility-associated lipoprotein GldH
MKNKILNLSLLVFSLLFFSCNDQAVFNEYQKFDGSWAKKQKLVFNTEQKDTKTVYNLFFNIRNNKDYPFDNLYLISKMTQPDGKVLVDTLEYEMAYKDGKLMGQGFSDVKESKLWYKENYSFPKPGKYKIEIEHALRQTGKVEPLKVLEGVTEFGLSIEKRK